jgi:hypothetical protein
LLAEPTLGPVQTLEVYDPLVAKIEAVLEHRRMLVDVGTLVLHHAQDQINKLPIEIRDQLTSNGKIEGRLRRLAQIDLDVSSMSTSRRCATSPALDRSWPQRCSLRSVIRSGSLASRSSPAGAEPAGGGRPRKHRLDYGGNRRINSVLYIDSVVQHRDLPDATIYIDRKLGEGKTRREARRAHKRHLANRVIRRMCKDETSCRERPINNAA